MAVIIDLALNAGKGADYMTQENRNRGGNAPGALAGTLWFIGWLFTIGSLLTWYGGGLYST